MFVPGTVTGRQSLDRLEGEIAELAGHINAAMCRWLLLIAEFEHRRGHEVSGFHCCAVWLSWRCGLAPRAAREHLRVARALGDLPEITAAFEHGELSYSKVRAITRVATGESEADLLELALEATAAQLERIVRAYRGALTVDEANAIDERRFFSWDWEDDGSLAVRGRLAGEEGALFLRAFEAAWDAVRERRTDEEVAEERSDGGSAEPAYPAGADVSPVDALVEMADASLGGERRTGGDRHQVVVHVDHTALSGDQEKPGSRNRGRCEVEDGSPLAVETARRLSCDASVVRIDELDGRMLSVGRKTRSLPPALRRALRARDGGCRFPGCGNHRFTDAHHIEHWADGGETSLENLIQLCRRHHRLLHEGGFTLEAQSDGRPLFRRPDGRRIAASPAVPRNRPGGVNAIPDANRRRGHEITPETVRSRSNGASFDLDLTVDVLCQRHKTPPKRAGPDK
jgi:hypothetical protein